MYTGGKGVDFAASLCFWKCGGGKKAISLSEEGVTHIIIKDDDQEEEDWVGGKYIIIRESEILAKAGVF